MLKTHRILLTPSPANGNEAGGGGGTTNPSKVGGEFVIDSKVPEEVLKGTLNLDDTGEPDDVDLNDGEGRNKENKTEKDTTNGKEIKSTEKKQVEEVKEEKVEKVEKVEEKPKKEEAKLGKLPTINFQKKATTPDAKAAVPAGARDYSKFTKEDAEVLKNVPNGAFAYFEKRLAELYGREGELKALKDSGVGAPFKATNDPSVLPHNWYEHPQAFVLHPHYQELNSELNAIEFETNFWKEQLTNIESGKDIRVLRGYDNKTGQPVISDPIKPTAELKVQIMGYVGQGQNQLAQITNQAKAFVGTFQQRHSTAMQYVQQILDEQFPWHKDDKSPMQEQVKDFYKAVPPEFMNHPSTKVSAILWATLVDGNLKYQEALKKIEKLEGIKTIEEKTEETASSVTPSEAGNKTKITSVAKPINGLPKHVPQVFDLEGVGD